jgi:hypothetical protein
MVYAALACVWFIVPALGQQNSRQSFDKGWLVARSGTMPGGSTKQVSKALKVKGSMMLRGESSTSATTGRSKGFSETIFQVARANLPGHDADGME